MHNKMILRLGAPLRSRPWALLAPAGLRGLRTRRTNERARAGRVRPSRPPGPQPDDINVMPFTTLLSAQIAEW